jgi:hypothetical protein
MAIWAMQQSMGLLMVIPPPSQIIVDLCRFPPGILCRFEIVLGCKVLIKSTPFPFVSGTLEELKLSKTTQNTDVRSDPLAKGLNLSPRFIPKDINPDRGIDKDHSLIFRSFL